MCDQCLMQPMFLSRLIFVVGVMFGVRPNAMVKITVDRFYYDNLNGKKVIIFTKKFGSRTDISRQNEGERAAIKKLVQILLLMFVY